MNYELRLEENRPATQVATNNTPITDKIKARGFRIFHNGRDLRLWPDGLSTQRQNEFLQHHRTAILAEIHSLWSAPVRCLECCHWERKCHVGQTRPMAEGGLSEYDLHHCMAFENRDP